MSLRTNLDAVKLAAPIAEPISPTTDGPDVSWLSRCRVGDDQGQTGACVLFSFASRAEIVQGREISDAECLEAYEYAKAEFDIPDGEGMSYRQGWQVAVTYGWVGQANPLRRVTTFDAIGQQPILAAYKVTDAWDGMNMRNGCFDHSEAHTEVRGYHAVVVPAIGVIGMQGGPRYIYVENSWGIHWGYMGLGLMSEDLHRRLCMEMWIVE